MFAACAKHFDEGGKYLTILFSQDAFFIMTAFARLNNTEQHIAARGHADSATIGELLIP
jgi:hypothetical protein